jgi:hypothetical protein
VLCWFAGAGFAGGDREVGAEMRRGGDPGVSGRGVVRWRTRGVEVTRVAKDVELEVKAAVARRLALGT